MYQVTRTCTVFDLISEHTLISGHPPFCAEIIARARIDLCIGCVIVLHHAIDI